MSNSCTELRIIRDLKRNNFCLGLSEFDLIKSNFNDVNETIVYLSTKHGVLKEFLTRYENDRLKIYHSLIKLIDQLDVYLKSI